MEYNVTLFFATGTQEYRCDVAPTYKEDSIEFVPVGKQKRLRARCDFLVESIVVDGPKEVIHSDAIFSVPIDDERY